MDKINQKVNTSLFKDVNGRILRNLNILDGSKCRLKALESLFEDISKIEEERHRRFIFSIDYLNQSGYIKLVNVLTDEPTQVNDTPFMEIEASLTPKGVRLLCGSLTDDCVDV